VAARLVALIAVTAALALAPASALALSFSAQDLAVKGKVLDVLPADVSGDGLKDLVVVSRAGLEPRFTRHVSVFVQKAGQGFAAKPDATAEAPADAALIDAAPTPGGRGESIYLLGHEGLYLWPPANGSGLGKPQLVRRQAGLIAFPDDDALPVYDFVRPWKGGARNWAMLPGSDRLTFIPIDAPGQAGEEVLVRADVETESVGKNDEGVVPFALRATVAIPTLAVEDADGDGRKDLFVARGEDAACHLQGEDGRFSPKADRFQHLAIRTQDERVLRNTNVISSAFDLNGDRLADLVVHKFGGSFPNLRSATQIHLGRRDGPARAEPSYRHDAEGFAGSVRFVDVDRDGRRDLVMPVSKLGISDLIRVILTKKVAVTVAVFLQRTAGLFAQKPDYTRQMVYQVDSRSGIAVIGISPNFEGDFNGDGKADLLVGAGGTAVEVYLGGRTPGKLFGPKPDATVTCPATISARVEDLTGDGASDFFAFYPLEPKLEGTLKVFLARKDLGR
jgi:hypothetical protein